MPAKNESLYFIQVGGTIDKDYRGTEDHHGLNFEIAEPAFLSILKRGAPHLQFSWKSIMKKDSLKMTGADFEQVASEIMGSRKRRVVVTHGSDKIFETAQALKAHANNNKTIVLTCSRLPEKFRETDADFSLGMAVSLAQFASAGIYVVTEGRIYLENTFGK